MDESLQRRGPNTSAIPHGSESIDLVITPEEALARLRDHVKLPIFTRAEADAPPSGVTFVTFEDDSFTIQRPESELKAMGRVPSFGSSLRGKLVRTADGARLELESRTVALNKSQRERWIVTAVVFTLALAGMIAQTGGAMTIALLGLTTLLYPLVGWLIGRRRSLHHIADMRSLVGNVYAPVTRVEAGEGPYRG